MRTITTALTVAALLVIGASAAPAADPVRYIEDAAISVLVTQERTTPETPEQVGPVTVTTTGSTIHQAPAPETAPTGDYPAACDDPTADVMLDPGTCPTEAPGADLPMPSLDSQIADCTAQTGDPVGCEEKIRYGIFD